MNSKNIKILITGSTGLLGSSLNAVFKKQDYKIFFLKCDISKKSEIKKYILESNIKKINYIIHTAAITDVEKCEKNKKECFQTNALGTKNVANLASILDAKLIYISTVSVFDGFKGNYKENSLPYPANYYNLSKYLGEIFVSQYDKGMILRTNLIGIHPNGLRGLNFFEWLCDSIQKNKNITLFSDVFINPLSNWTLAEVIKKIIKSNIHEKIIHVGSENRMSKAEIGMLVRKKFKKYNGNIRITSVDEFSKNIKRPKQMWLNTDLIQKKLNIKMPKLESEINKILLYYKNYEKNYFYYNNKVISY